MKAWSVFLPCHMQPSSDTKYKLFAGIPVSELSDYDYKKGMKIDSIR